MEKESIENCQSKCLQKSFDELLVINVGVNEVPVRIIFIKNCFEDIIWFQKNMEASKYPTMHLVLPMLQTAIDVLNEKLKEGNIVVLKRFWMTKSVP